LSFRAPATTVVLPVNAKRGISKINDGLFPMNFSYNLT
jgi:hypothetical protein